MERSDFDRLMERYVMGQVTEEEKARIEAWLAFLKAEGASDLELSREAEDKIYRRITGNMKLEETLAGLAPVDRSFKRRQWFIRIAATLLLLAVVGFFGWRVFDGKPGIFSSGSDMIVEKLILNDGSLVWLYGKSKLIYYEKPGEGIRYSELEGDALFEVTKDPEHPFVLQCGQARILVVGTSFRVKSHDDSIALMVLTGKVKFSVGNAYVEEVSANEQIIYTRNQGKKSSFGSGEIDALTMDTEYIMQFEDHSLAEVAQRLSKKFDVNILIQDEHARRCRITADFTDLGLEESLRTITEILDIDYVRDHDRITLRGKGCR